MKQQNSAQYNVPCGSHPQQKMNIHLPEGNGPHPVLIFIHGGAWHWGDKGDNDNTAQNYCNNRIKEHIDNCFPKISLEERDVLYRGYSPLYLVEKDLPATLLIHGTADKTVPDTDSIRLAKALEEHGGACNLFPC